MWSVKFAPKMSSSGFLSDPGVVVFSTDSLLGSMSSGLELEAASGLMLYDRADCHDPSRDRGVWVATHLKLAQRENIGRIILGDGYQKRSGGR